MESNKRPVGKLVRASPDKQSCSGGYFTIGEAGLVIDLELAPLSDPRPDILRELQSTKQPAEIHNGS